MSAFLKKSLLLQEIPVTGDAKMPLKTSEGVGVFDSESCPLIWSAQSLTCW